MKKLVPRKIKIQRSILLVFLLAVLIIVLFIKLISANMANTRNTDFLVNNTYEVIKRIESVGLGIAETESATRAYVATEDKRWHSSLTETQQEIISLLNGTGQLIMDSLQKNRLAELKKLIQQKIVFQQAIIHTPSAELKQKISYDGQDRLATQEIKSMLSQFMTRHRQLLQRRLADSNYAKNKALGTVIIGSAIIFIFITGTLIRLNKDVSRRKEIEKEIRESESKYRQLIEEAGVTMFTADLSGIFTYVSSRCYSLTGYTPEELIGKSFSMLVLPDSIDNVIALYSQQLSNLQKESTIEFPIITKEGHLKWVEQYATLLIDEQNQPTGYQCVVQDITERKAAAQRIKRSEELIKAQREEYQFRLQSILDNTPAIVFIKDLEGRYLIINKSFREIYGLSDEQVIGKTDFDFNTGEEATRHKKVDEEVIRTHRSVETEETFHTYNGTHSLLLIKFPLFDKDNNIYGVGAIGTDITENMPGRQRLVEER